MDDLYQTAKNQVIHQLYLASRAYAFWAWKDYAFYQLLGLQAPATINAVALDAARVQILEPLCRHD